MWLNLSENSVEVPKGWSNEIRTACNNYLSLKPDVASAALARRPLGAA